MKILPQIIGLLLVFGFIAVMATGWIKNVIKLSECDFKAPYKAEVIRTVGIIPPIGAVVGYLDIKDGDNQ